MECGAWRMVGMVGSGGVLCGGWSGVGWVVGVVGVGGGGGCGGGWELCSGYKSMKCR